MDILCHIVGMNNKVKEGFYEDIETKYKDVKIVDLDKITNSIRTGNHFKKICKLFFVKNLI